MNIKNFLEIYEKNVASNNVNDLLGDTLILKLSFREDFIAFTKHEQKAILINEQNLDFISEEYVLLHEYFHMLQNESYPLKKNVLKASSLKELEGADLFASKFLIENGQKEKVPNSILSIMIKNKEKFKINDVD